MAIAEIAVSRMLGIEVGALQSDARPLAFAASASVLLKRAKNVDKVAVRPVIELARHAARHVLSALKDVPPFGGPLSAADARDRLLKRFRVVDLDALLDLAWSHGVVVLHLNELPKSSPHFTALATFIGATPVVVLASKRDAPPWLAYHLAHELGHVMLSHVRGDGDTIADAELEEASSEAVEKQADRFALELLTGSQDPKIETHKGLKGYDLYAVASVRSRAQRIDPGTFCLLHAKQFDRFPVAQTALGLLGCGTGAKAAIGRRLREHLIEERAETSDAALAMMSTD